MDRTGIDTVLFDLDDTICTYRRDGGDVLDIAFAEVGVEPFFDVDDYLEWIRSMDVTAPTFADLREACFVDLTTEAGRDPNLGRRLASVYAEERDQTNVAFCPGARRALGTLADGYSLGLVTNGGPDIQTPKLEALDIRGLFDTIVHAGYDTPAKPDPAPFEHALSAIGSNPDRTAHVGNSLAADIAGAKRAGLTAIWLDDGRDPVPRPDFTIDSLEELAEPPWD